LGPGSDLYPLKPPGAVSSSPLPVPVYAPKIPNQVSLGKQPHAFWRHENLLGDEGAGEMVKGTDYSSEGPKFKSQQPHGGSQPSVMKSDSFFWSV
jgi:hypothetical protein